MGNICKHTVLMGATDSYQKVTINNFICEQKMENGQQVDDIIGQGGFAVVKRVRRREGSITSYAMKTMSKLQVSLQKNIQPTMNEMFILRDIQHPFLIDMKWAFHDDSQLYLIMKELKGKDLRFHLTHFKIKDDMLLKDRQTELEQKKEELNCVRKNQNFDQPTANQDKDKTEVKPSELSSFTENQSRFFIAQICLALNYLHHKAIIHRDIKPENILFEDDGYLRITDLGIAKKFRNNNSTDTSGTPGYMAPEVLCRQNHNYAVDYYAVGVIAYELMLNRRPYENMDKGDKKENYRTDLIKNILQSQIQVVPIENSNQYAGFVQAKVIKNQYFTYICAPKDWTLAGIDFINQCLKRKPTERLGYYDVNQVIEHEWFKDIDFDLLARKKYKNIPFCATHIARSCKRNAVLKWLEEELRNLQRHIDVIKEERNKKNIERREINNGTDMEENSIRDIQQQRQVQQEYIQQEILNQEQDAMNLQKLRNIQHFFKQYYFDRERYSVELSYLEERRNQEKGKQIFTNNNILESPLNSPKRSSVISPYNDYDKDYYSGEQGDDPQQEFPEIQLEERLDSDYLFQMTHQPTFNNQRHNNNRASIINPQQVQNNLVRQNQISSQSIVNSTIADSSVSSKRFNDSISSRSEANVSFLSKKSNAENRSMEMSMMSNTPNKQITPQINISTNKQQSNSIFQKPLRSIAENNQQYQKK